MDGFSRILVDDCAARLGDDGLRMLGVIRSETQRMARLIDDLLAFSRLGRQQIEQVRIDMHALAQEVFDELAALDPGRQLRLDLRPLPPAFGTATMIRQVWVNLISNAIKFTKEREVGEIEIGTRDNEDGGGAGRSITSKTTVPASTCVMRTSYSGFSSACTPSRSLQEPAWAWRSSSASCNAMAAASGRRRKSIAARSFTSHYPIHHEEHTNWKSC